MSSLICNHVQIAGAVACCDIKPLVAGVESKHVPVCKGNKTDSMSRLKGKAHEIFLNYFFTLKKKKLTHGFGIVASRMLQLELHCSWI